MHDPINDVKNVLLSTALDAAGIPSYMAGRDTSGPAPKWMTENREFTPGINQDMPKPLNVGASMMIQPVVLEVSAFVNDEKTTEYYSLRDFEPDSARLKFQMKYYSKTVRGLTVHPLYDLGRYA